MVLTNLILIRNTNINMPLDALSFLGLAAITIVIGYIGSLFFKKTGVPDVIWLLLLGLVLGPLLNLIDRTLYIAVLPLLSALALIMILFDAGLSMDFYQVIRSFPRSLLLAIVGVVFSMIAVSLFMVFFLNFNITEGLLLGSIVGGTSSASVASIARRVGGIRENVKTLLTLESILNDPLTIVIPIVLVGFLTATTQINPIDPAISIVSAFSIGGMLGLLGGLIWQTIADRLKEKHLEYILTLAAIFVVYITVEALHGSGPIAALLFGLVVGNKKVIYGILKMRQRSREGFDNVKATQAELSFFIRSFFFVYLGLIAVINTQFILYGVGVVAVLIVTRLAFTQFCMVKMHLRENEKNIIRIMAPRGLAAAVMIQLPLTLGLPHAAEMFNIGFIVILGTTLYTTVMAFVFRGHRHNHKKGKH